MERPDVRDVGLWDLGGVPCSGVLLVRPGRKTDVSCSWITMKQSAPYVVSTSWWSVVEPGLALGAISMWILVPQDTAGIHVDGVFG